MDYKIVKIFLFKVVGKSKDFLFDDFVKNGLSFWKEYVSLDNYKKFC